MLNNKLLLAIDLGEKKCGCALLSCGVGSPADAKLVEAQRMPNQSVGEFIERFADTPRGTLHVVYEDYLVYKSKLNAHLYSRVRTVSAAGIIEYTCNKHHIPWRKYKAGDWKQATTVSFRQRYDFWPSVNAADNDHIRDASGLGLYTFRTKGIFNEGERVMTWLDLKILED